MKICKRIISSALAFVICLSLYLLPASAAWQNDLGHWYVNSNFAQWTVGSLLTAGAVAGGGALGGVVGTVIVPGAGTATGASVGGALGEYVSDVLADGVYDLASYYAAGYTDEAFYEAEGGFVSDLDRTDASFTVALSGFSATIASSSSPYPFGYGVAKLAYNSPSNTVALLESLGVNNRVAIVGIGRESPYYLMGVYFDEYGIFRGGKFENPFGIANAMYFGVYSLTDLNLIASDPIPFNNASEYTIFYSESDAKQYDGFSTRDCLAFDFDRVWESQKSTEVMFYFTKKISTNTDFSGTTYHYMGVTTDNYDVWGVDSYYPDGITWDNSHIVIQPAETDSSSRTSSLMQAIHTYNTNNSYVDNSTNVNFFLVPSGEDPAEDTVVSPVIYDEETLVYTDPVTGTQYLTNGWTYDYLTRCYTLAMADESYLIGETVIDTIKLTYGDELLTVDHYSGGSLIQSDKYNYVMLSGSACAIDGHTYNVETTKEPTCTAAGERTYTCSVCGNQYVEEIPQTDHIYADFTVVHEATCTSKGITSYTCSTCGGEYTELLDALGHDWQPTAATEEAYVMPDNVHCPDCYGANFTYTRSDYEILTGKNLFNFPERRYIYTDALDSTSLRHFDSGTAYVGLSVNNYFNNSKIVSFEYDVDSRSFDVAGLGGYGVGFPFALTPGKQYSLSAVTSGDAVVFPAFYDSEGKLLSYETSNFLNSSFTVPAGAYWTVLLFREEIDSDGIVASFSDIQLEEGLMITEYEPYTTKEIEIIPPIYTFTCSDCSTVWTKEAEYQGATVTYTCTRCHETRTEASGEEAGLFHSIGNLIADGITWATDKLTQLVENLSGINKTFNDYANSIRENTGQFPAFLGAILALMPEDFMNVIWLGVVALVALAVWKKWFS